MVAQSLLDPITMATRAGLLREDMRLKTPVVRNTLLSRAQRIACNTGKENGCAVKNRAVVVRGNNKTDRIQAVCFERLLKIPCGQVLFVECVADINMIHHAGVDIRAGFRYTEAI